MTSDHNRAELRRPLARASGLLGGVIIFGILVNALMLTGPIYMLQVYDRVLSSRSVETLVALSLIVAFLYAMMGLLDYARGRVMGRVAGRFQSSLDRRVFDASLRRAGSNTPGGLRDLEAIQKFIASPVLLAFFDVPWTPIFIAGIFIFHPWMGWLAVLGGVLIVTVSLVNQMLSKRPQREAATASLQADMLGDRMQTESELIRALGMRGATFKRWGVLRNAGLRKGIAASDISGTFQSITKTLRLFLQSAMLGLGALLVLRGELSPGAMIAGSILLGRALAPVEQLIGQWAMVQRAGQSWRDLGALLGSVPPEMDRTPLPAPKAHLDLNQVTVVPAGEEDPALKGVSFTLKPGQACGVIGPSGAGKSTLAKAITGVWAPRSGAIRLDGAALDNYDPDVLGGLIGYLPQRVQLFEGTLTENIARLSVSPDVDAVHRAAKLAAAHDMILKLPDGYDTWVDANGGRLSGGQIQRIGLARAMYGDPVLLVLDEPNSNLDSLGNEALNAAIRAQVAAEGSVLVMAHRPAAIQECDTLLMIDGGRVKAYGPKEDVLRSVLKHQPQGQRDLSESEKNG